MSYNRVRTRVIPCYSINKADFFLLFHFIFILFFKLGGFIKAAILCGYRDSYNILLGE